MSQASSFLVSLVDSAVRSLLFAMAVGLGLMALRVRNVVAQKAAWILVLAASLAMPLLAQWATHLAWLPERDTFVIPGRTWTGSATNTTPAPTPAATVAKTASSYANLPKASAHARRNIPHRSQAVMAESSRYPATAVAPANPAHLLPAPLAAPAPSRNARMDPIRAGFLLYLAICGVLLFRLFYGAWVAARLWRRATPVQLGESFLAGDIAVRSSDATSSPLTVGSGIVLPAGYAAWDAEKLRIVLAHEGSHVRQRDFALQLAASLYIAFFWCSPLGWWIKRKLSRLSETISDGAAVNQAASHASYAQVLLEFAAMPRPIPIGVAMAHRGHLRSRIEHLLNENRFRQAFSGGRARLAAAVLVVPVALFAATALVRVHAAGQQVPPAQAPEPASAPAQAPAQAAPVNPAPTPVAPPEATAPPVNTPPPAAVVSDDDQVLTAPNGTVILTAPKAPGAPGSPDVVLAPSAPGGWGPGTSGAWVADSKAWAKMAKARAAMQADMAKNMAAFNKQQYFFRDGFFNDGNSYAYVTGQGKEGIHYSGGWYQGSQEEIEKARKAAHGDFIWFERDGKSYVIDDAATVASLKPMQDQMDDLGKQQEALGKQQEELGSQQEALGKKMEEARVPTPDVSKEMADLNAAIAKLNQKKGGTVSQEDLGDLQGKLAEVEGKLGGIEGEIGQKQGDIGRQQGDLGRKQGELGRQQGQLGRQQGRIAREMDGKVLTIIDESLKDGKARPVQ